MDRSSLPNGFITVEDAVDLIKTNTFEKPTVDIKYLVGHLDWVEVAHNFRIPKVRLVTKEEYAELLKKFPGRRPSELTSVADEYVTLRTSYEVELLKKTIRDNYRDITGHSYNKANTRGITTVIDEEKGTDAAPRATKNTIAKEGSVIGSGSTVSTNSADGAGV
jgi:hypothetical protein